MTKVAVIINPVSGPARRGSAATRAERAARALEHTGAKADIRLTEHGGHAYEMAMEAAAAGIELVIAWGGDGTVNEVARAIVQSTQQAPPGHRQPALGIVPAGSGNGLARALGIPFNPSAAIERAIRSEARTIDAGELGGRLFLNIAGIGLDAHVAALVSTRVNHRGLLPYLKASAGDLLRYKPADYTITADTDTFEVSALVLALANSTQYGFGAAIAPAARLDDGSLDLVIVEDRTLRGNLLRIPSLVLGRLNRQEGIRTRLVREVTIRAREPMLFHVDGEAVQGADMLIARVHPGALRLRA